MRSVIKQIADEYKINLSDLTFDWMEKKSNSTNKGSQSLPNDSTKISSPPKKNTNAGNNPVIKS